MTGAGVAPGLPSLISLIWQGPWDLRLNLNCCLLSSPGTPAGSRSEPAAPALASTLALT